MATITLPSTTIEVTEAVSVRGNIYHKAAFTLADGRRVFMNVVAPAKKRVPKAIEHARKLMGTPDMLEDLIKSLDPAMLKTLAEVVKTK